MNQMMTDELQNAIRQPTKITDIQPTKEGMVEASTQTVEGGITPKDIVLSTLTGKGEDDIENYMEIRGLEWREDTYQKTKIVKT